MHHSRRHVDLTPGVARRAACVKRGSQVLIDIVEYVVQNHDSINVSPVVRSAPKNADPKWVGFTMGIGKLTLFRVFYYRRLEVFRNETRAIANAVWNETCRRTAGKHIKHGIKQYVRFLGTTDPMVYFAFFAVICEVCILLRQRVDYVNEVVHAAMAVMDRRRLKFPGWRVLDLYAREILQVCTILQRLKDGYYRTRFGTRVQSTPGIMLGTPVQTLSHEFQYRKPVTYLTIVRQKTKELNEIYIDYLHE